MPTYEYTCPNGHRHDRMYVKSGDYRPVPCPECMKSAQRVASLPLRAIVKGGTPIHHHTAGRGK